MHDVLCNDSPEGRFGDEVCENDDAGAKDLLSFSWRALKESRCALSRQYRRATNENSLLLRTIISKATYDTGSSSILEDADLAAIGNLTFSQLSELRHRGAFTTVSTTFAACCQRCTDIKATQVQQLLWYWYQVRSSNLRRATHLTR